MARPTPINTSIEPHKRDKGRVALEAAINKQFEEVDDSPTGYNVGLMGPSKYTGEALSVVCFENNGFRNFKLCKMKIKAGKVVSVEYGNPYASFEALGFLEMISQFSIMKCGNNWEHGKSWVIADGKF